MLGVLAGRVTALAALTAAAAVISAAPARAASAPARAAHGTIRLSVPDAFLVYLNRLSDLLFALARLANHRAGQPDVTVEVGTTLELRTRKAK